jgi:hypothetical protein
MLKVFKHATKNRVSTIWRIYASRQSHKGPAGFPPHPREWFIVVMYQDILNFEF